MIIFSCLKKEFDLYVKKGIISNKVYEAYKDKMGKKTTLNQIKSWANSLPVMNFILQNLPDSTGIAIEFNIPLTSKRIDLVVSGYNFNYEPILLLFELKQWEVTYNVKSEDAVIKTIISNKEKVCLHPSYQVMCYAELLLNYNQYIEHNHVHVIPFVYLHNYSFQANDPLLLNKFRKYYTNAPIYGKDDKYILRAIVNHYIKFGDNLELIEQIDKSEVKPNKKLLEAITNMIQDKKEYTLLDEQKVIAEAIKKEAKQAFTTNKKMVIIVKGGPGTGKSYWLLTYLENY